MRCAAKIKPHPNDHLPPPILIGALGEVDPGPSYVKDKLFPPISRDEWDGHHASEVRIVPL